jgi:hypothetical protein
MSGDDVPRGFAAQSVEVQFGQSVVQRMPEEIGIYAFEGLQRTRFGVDKRARAADIRYARVRIEQTEPMFPGHYSNLFSVTPSAVIDRDRITLRVPDGMPLRIENEGYAEKRTEGDGNVTYEWTAQQTTTEQPEAGSISALDYSRRLSVSTFPRYADFARAYAARATDKAQVGASISFPPFSAAWFHGFRGRMVESLRVAPGRAVR